MGGRHDETAEELRTAFAATALARLQQEQAVSLRSDWLASLALSLRFARFLAALGHV